MARNNLDKRYREIDTIAVLTALGNSKPQLKFHINAGLNVGLTNYIDEDINKFNIFISFLC